MEVKRGNKKWAGRLLYTLAFIMLAFHVLHAQSNHAKCEFRNREFYIELNKNIGINALDSFVIAFNLETLNLRSVMQTSNLDTLKKLGWNILLNSPQKLIITKPLAGSRDINNPVEAIINSEKHGSIADRFPVVDDKVVFGYNRFKNKNPFAEKGVAVRFFLRNNSNAKRVVLAGSFNNWSPDNWIMTKTDSGWIADVNLDPGKYWYKFIADGNWMIDNDNLLKENDGLGNINSVFFKTNTIFKLDAATDSKKVFLAGSFNNWRPNELLMQRTRTGWQLALYLANGTHTYKFVTDRDWLTDPANSHRLPDSEGGFNSVISLGPLYVFELKGYSDAKKVWVAGSFNNWRKEELEMKKTGTGWELSYAVRPGNYEYRFIVDGKEMADPSNPLRVNAAGNKVNSFLIIEANYTFRLKMPGAKSVFLSGDFNNWSPNSLPMIRQGDEWMYKVHLSPGKHKYKFVVDNKWIMDPANKQWEQNEFGTGNSVIWIDNQPAAKRKVI